MKSLLQAVQDLSSAELYDDLNFLVALRLEEHLLDDELAENEQALLFKLVGDAHYHTECYFQSIKFYERALEIVKRLPRNSYSKSISQSELRFSIHKALLREKNYEEAMRTLSLIPKNEHTPKTRAALAKLLTIRQPNSKAEILTCHNFVLSQFPSTAPYTYNELTNLGPISRRYVKEQVDETASSIYFKARSLVNELKPMNAIAALREYRQPNAKLILELATLYNFVGNRSKAIAELERLRLVDPNGIRGMDLLASLYYANQLTNKFSNELQSLVGYLNECHPNQPETFVAMAYLTKLQDNPVDAQAFAQRAMNLSSSGKDKANGALLRALILIEGQKNFAVADQFLNNILKIDNQNIDAYELSLRSHLQRKSFKEARAIGQTCLSVIGPENPRANFIYAQSIYGEPGRKEEFERMIKKIVEESPFLTDAILLLAKYYDREACNYSNAVEILKKAAEVNLNPIVQSITNDMESKCKKTPDSSGVFQSSILNPADYIIPNSLNSTPSAFAATPDCGIPTSINYNRGVQGAPRRQRSNAIRQSGVDLMQQIDFADSFELDAIRQDLFTNSNGFRTPSNNAFIDELDEDIDVTTNISFLRRS